MNTKSTFIMIAAILVTSILIIGITAPQQAEAQKKVRYCYNFIPLDDPVYRSEHCFSSQQECEDLREDTENSGSSADISSSCYQADPKRSCFSFNYDDGEGNAGTGEQCYATEESCETGRQHFEQHGLEGVVSVSSSCYEGEKIKKNK